MNNKVLINVNVPSLEKHFDKGAFSKTIAKSSYADF